MPTLFSFDGFKLKIYLTEHGIPHVHLINADYEASISIETGTVIVGEVPAQALETARMYIEANRETLLSMWRK